MNLNIHEALELHELISFKTNCVAKARIWYETVSDPQLKKLIQTDLTTGINQISQLKELLENQTF